MGELIKEGKIRHWGLSNETSYGACRGGSWTQNVGELRNAGCSMWASPPPLLPATCCFMAPLLRCCRPASCRALHTARWLSSASDVLQDGAWHQHNAM